jgi:hypothetical protein
MKDVEINTKWIRSCLKSQIVRVYSSLDLREVFSNVWLKAFFIIAYLI